MGCGWRNFGKEWIHVDGGDYDHLDHSDIFLSLYDDNFVELIYSSHLISYFNADEIEKLLSSWNRVLKSNGILRISVPDFKVIADLYSNGKYSLDYFLGPLYGKMTMGNDIIYHKIVYDWLSLKNLLEKGNFREVVKYDWKDVEHSGSDDFSQAYLPHMDKVNGTLLSLNVECIK